MKRQAILLVNIGTPDSPSVADVRKFLSEFLNDKRVITLPWLVRKILVNLIIVPFRAPRSAALYRQLWSADGSPLLIHSKSLVRKLQVRMGEKYALFLAMRYGNPGLERVIASLIKDQYDELVLVPLYPQWAEATTESTIARVKEILHDSGDSIAIRIVPPFFNHPAFVDAFSHLASRYQPGTWDHVIFSFHGLPITKDGGSERYRTACCETAFAIAKKLTLSENGYSISFQSRLTKNWLSPFTDQTLTNLAQEGKKRVLILSPSFVADCLETVVEIGIEYRNLFISLGGSELQLVESLNDNDMWVSGLQELIEEQL